MHSTLQLALDWTESGLLPDSVVRAGIRRFCQARLRNIRAEDCAASAEILEQFLIEMDSAPIALLPHLANDQHYELPPEFYVKVLGPHRKYSACWWGNGVNDLGGAEAQSLRLTCTHADLRDGQRILELGCGWGSLTLWMASHFPNSKIVAVSNSRSQREFIVRAARELGVSNIEVITCDMNSFDTDERFDRVVSVEMFEHMRNWRLLFGKVHDLLFPGGRFFMHVFCHRSTPYAFEAKDTSDWMSQHFFSGGMMPSDDLALRFQDHLRIVKKWRWDGTHYEKTANAWLTNLDAKRPLITPLLAAVHGAECTDLWIQRWRIFFMACAELFGYNAGQEWWVSHYLFERPAEGFKTLATQCAHAG